MSEALRGFVLLLSVLLWLPALRPFLSGQMRTDEAALRYGGALLLAWGGVSLLAAIVRAYTPEPEKAATEPTPAQRAGLRPDPTEAATDDPGLVDDGESEFLPDGTPRRRADGLAR